MIITFEDLSNEIIYEVFELLNFCHVYQSFFNLNQRFQNRLTHSRLPINVDFSSISKTTFEFYYTNILTPHQRRIKTLHLPNTFVLNRIFSSSDQSFQFTRLEQLSVTIYGTTSLHNLFTILRSLPQLLSLTIKVKSKYVNYQENPYGMFHSPRMGYQRVMNENSFTKKPYIFPPTEFKSVQYLFLDYPIYLNEVSTLLLIFPGLRHLSLQNLKNSSQQQTKLQPISLNYLKHLSHKLDRISFHQFQSMVKNLFTQVQNLSVTVKDTEEYLDASQWRELISFHMPHIRVLDILISSRGRDYGNLSSLKKSVDQFHDCFWSVRKWYFEHSIIQHKWNNYLVLHSINPYR